MGNLGEKRKAWLAAFDWDGVTALNATLCAKTGSLHAPTSDGYQECRDFWLQRFRKESDFREALVILKQCHRLAPFCFNNGNTFAAIARTMVLQAGTGPMAAIARSAAGHYVAGVLREDELDGILSGIPAD